MAPEPEPLLLDLADFDAVGVATALVVTLRTHAIVHEVDAAATIAAPPGWHRVVVTARSSGHVVLAVRYDELTSSRLRNVASALGERGWQLDEDGEGATRRFPPGSEASSAAFGLLDALTVSGAPRTVRPATAVDGHGARVALH